MQENFKNTQTLKNKPFLSRDRIHVSRVKQICTLFIIIKTNNGSSYICRIRRYLELFVWVLITNTTFKFQAGQVIKVRYSYNVFKVSQLLH